LIGSPSSLVRVLLTLPLFLQAAPLVRAQGNYEVQVYGSEMVPPGRTMFELHSNFTFEGSKFTIDGVRPDEHALHETVEITQGFTPWFEVGFYIFTSYRASEGYQWVGDHIRPRVRVPEEWHWPVNVSISTELGYQRRDYSPDTWTWEIRPIADKQLGRWYMAVNPALERSFHGLDVHQGVTFSPAAKVSYDVTKRITFGFEYYGAVGSITGFDAVRDQQQAIMPALDLNLGPNWEFNLAAGIGVTQGTDHLLVKMIIGRRLKFGKR
jgi:Putative MetA-pathway of phenol degradation